jgi:cell division protein FtsQ
MKKKRVIAILLFILLTTINPHQEISFNKFNLKKIEIENNSLLDEKEIKKLLVSINNKNLIFLKFKEIENALMKNNFIEGFNIKKKYPNTLKIKIFEKKPIAILINKKKKFYLSEKIDLIKFRNLQNYDDLPYVFGNENNFKIFYENLKEINFPLSIIKKYTFFESNRWDIETVDEKLIKLPTNNYSNSLENYLKMRKKNNFSKYKIFDYRINNQIILK